MYRILTNSGEVVEAVVERVDPTEDLSLLRLKGPCSALSLALASEDAAIGERVFLCASMRGSPSTVMTGFVASRPHLEYNSIAADYFLVTSITALPGIGSSGGPWVNGDGRIVGIQSHRIREDSGARIGLASMVPASVVQAFLDRRQSAGVASVGAYLVRLGDKDRTFAGQFARGSSGVVVESLLPGGALDRSGTRVGELITRIGDESVTSVEQVVNRIRACRPGALITLTVVDSAGTCSERRVVLDDRQ